MPRQPLCIQVAINCYSLMKKSAFKSCRLSSIHRLSEQQDQFCWLSCQENAVQSTPPPTTSPEACKLLTTLANNKNPFQHRIQIFGVDTAFASNHVDLPRKQGGFAHDSCSPDEYAELMPGNALSTASYLCTIRAWHAQILTGNCRRPAGPGTSHVCIVLRPQHVALAVHTHIHVVVQSSRFRATSTTATLLREQFAITY